MVTLPRYAELHCRSNFSFLTGASALFLKTYLVGGRS